MNANVYRSEEDYNNCENWRRVEFGLTEWILGKRPSLMSLLDVILSRDLSMRAKIIKDNRFISLSDYTKPIECGIYVINVSNIDNINIYAIISQ
jgi:hypothetical protein